MTCKLPTRCGPIWAADAHSRNVTRSSSRFARSASNAASRSTARRAPILRFASAMQMSGPMPAGSPDVTTMTGSSLVTMLPRRPRGRGRGSDLELYECLVAEPPQPQLALFLGLARADLPRALLALDLVGRVVRAALEHFDEV